MLLTRRTAAFLLVVGAFQWAIWPNFLRNIWNDDRAFADGSPTAFLVVHAVLTGTSLLLGTGVLVLGWRGWRRAAR